jgi:PAS domain S-box-containing protein
VQLDALNESTLIALGSAAMVLVMAGVCVILIRRCRRLGRYARRARRHRAAIARLRRSTELSAADRYWGQIRSATAPVLVTSPEGAILAASGAATELFGYQTEEQLRAISVADLYFNPTDRLKSLSTPLLEQGHIRSSEFRMKRCDGRPVNVLTSVRLVMSEGATFYEGVLTDITELRAAFDERQHLESQLHLAKKLELVGRLASGIAHEINTPMQFIGDNVTFLKRAFAQIAAQLPAAPQKMQELLADVADAFDGSFEGVERVSETVRAMKEFAHPGDLDMAATDLNQAIRTILVVARSEYKHAAEVKLELGDIPPVNCTRAEINKVFLNLIVNAAHAIEESGKGRGTITIRSSSEGGRVRIEIADTGCGIPATVIPRIFEPFFTTKAIGKGSGQGLAIARSVVRNHGGEMEVASVVGQGTTFTIGLPAADGVVATEGAPSVSLVLEDSIG